MWDTTLINLFNVVIMSPAKVKRANGIGYSYFDYIDLLVVEYNQVFVK